MDTINIAEDFAKDTGARDYSDGPKSGREFFDTLLRSKFKDAIDNGTQLQVILDGTSGFASSFLNESFRLLAKEFGSDTVWNNLILVSNEVPKYISKIKDAIYEKK